MHFVYGAIIASILMDVAIKLTSAEVSTWSMVALRWIFAAFILIPFVVHRFSASDYTPLKFIYIVRTLLNLIGTFCLFHALQNLQLSLVVAIFFSEPLFTTIFAAILGKEAVGRRGWATSLTGFVGVVLVVLGSAEEKIALSDEAIVHSLVAVLGAASWGLMSVVTKIYGVRQSSLALVFWLAVTTAVAGSIMAGHELLEVSRRDLFLIFSAACLGSVYSILWVKSLKKISANRVSSAMYLTLPLGYLIGYLVFNQVPDTMAWIGSFIIMSVVFISSNPKFIVKSINLFKTKWGN